MKIAGDSPINIYLLVQNRLVREAFVRLFRKRSGLTVVGASQECAEALQELAATPCDVLLLDSLEALHALKLKAETAEYLRNLKPMLFAMQEDPKRFLEAVRLNACGYLLNDASSAEMIAAVRSVAQGEAICPPRLCKSLFEYVSRNPLPRPGITVEHRRAARKLTFRQRQLMTLVAKGMTNKEIAASLQLSEFTIKNHIHRVMAQLRAENRHHAVDVIRTGGLFLSA